MIITVIANMHSVPLAGRRSAPPGTGFPWPPSCSLLTARPWARDQFPGSFLPSIFLRPSDLRLVIVASVIPFYCSSAIMSADRKRIYILKNLAGAVLQFVFFCWSQRKDTHTNTHTYLWMFNSHVAKPCRQWASARWSAACSPSRLCNSSVLCRRS